MSVIVKSEIPYVILVVDDTPNILKLISGHLTKVGYEVLTAPDAMHGLEILEKKTPDLIISDVTMPEIDGFEFYRRVKDITRLQEVPFVFLSAGTEITQIMRGLESGADDYLTKPIQLKELVAKIEMTIRKAKAKTTIRTSEDQLSGTLEDKSIADLFSFCEANALTGLLKIHISDEEQAVIRYRRGLIVAVKMGQYSDDEALDAILDLTEGEFTIIREELRLDADEADEKTIREEETSVVFIEKARPPQEIHEDVVIDDHETIEAPKDDSIWTKFKRRFFG